MRESMALYKQLCFTFALTVVPQLSTEAAVLRLQEQYTTVCVFVCTLWVKEDHLNFQLTTDNGIKYIKKNAYDFVCSGACLIKLATLTWMVIHFIVKVFSDNCGKYLQDGRIYSWLKVTAPEIYRDAQIYKNIFRKFCQSFNQHHD